MPVFLTLESNISYGNSGDKSSRIHRAQRSSGVRSLLIAPRFKRSVTNAITITNFSRCSGDAADCGLDQLAFVPFHIHFEAAQFMLDTLLEEPKHKWLVTCPSLSPENAHPETPYRLKTQSGPTGGCTTMHRRWARNPRAGRR